MTYRESKRIENGWWCDLHEEVHIGEIQQDFSMEHRKHLHPLYAHLRRETGQ